jgi:transcriptional regulator with XRE-family HTH domain
MTQTNALIDTLKKALKSQRLTYADVAHYLDMSEANVKRMFASKRFSLDRCEEICELMQMELSDLFQLYEESRQRINRLSEAQEKGLVANEKLLLVAVSVRNRLSFEDIVNNYEISENECIRYLAKLDKLKIIDLLPNNRIKLRIDDGFSWIKNGPIETFFERQIQSQFLRSRFNGDYEERKFLFGLLSDSSVQIILKKIYALANEFAELHGQDASLPLDKRHSIGLMMALRPWELQAFQPLQKKSGINVGDFKQV